jgi:TonB family protein
LVNGDDSRLIHDITLPEKARRQRDPGDFYPIAANKQGLEGWVLVSYVVEADGRTSWAGVLRSSGSPLFDDAALEYVKSVTYESPAYLGFTRVRIYLVMPVVFKLR